MLALPKPEVIITHESDLDGFLAGTLLQRLAQHLFGVTVRLEAYHYNYWKVRDLREKSAWVTDFTFEARMDKPDWLVVDHHVTEAKPKSALLVHDVTKSAGLLAYELCQQHGLGSPALDRLVHLNDVADLFLEADPDFAVAGDYASLVKIYQFWNLHTLLGGDIEKLLDHPLLEVMAVKRRVEISRAADVVPALELDLRQLPQPQRRSASNRAEIPGRRPRECGGRDPAQVRPHHRSEEHTSE